MIEWQYSGRKKKIKRKTLKAMIKGKGITFLITKFLITEFL